MKEMSEKWEEYFLRRKQYLPKGIESEFPVQYDGS